MMYLPIYCGLLLGVITIAFAAPTKSANACGYDVREFNRYFLFTLPIILIVGMQLR
jgi:hypothetical protein